MILKTRGQLLLLFSEFRFLLSPRKFSAFYQRIQYFLLLGNLHIGSIGNKICRVAFCNYSYLKLMWFGLFHKIYNIYVKFALCTISIIAIMISLRPACITSIIERHCLNILLICKRVKYFFSYTSATI